MAVVARQPNPGNLRLIDPISVGDWMNLHLLSLSFQSCCLTTTTVFLVDPHRGISRNLVR